MRIVNLRSDTFTLPTPEMYDRLRSSTLGDDVYQEDPTVLALEERAARMTGKESALLVMSGTQGNLISLMATTERGDEILLGQNTDLCNFENGATAAIGGLYARPLEDRRGWVDPADVERAIRPKDVHFGRTRVLCVENTHARTGGRPVPLGILAELRAVALRHGISIHIDGARLFNAATAQGLPASEICRFADTVTFCLSKGLSAPIGAIVCGASATIAKARSVRKMLGGGIRQAGWIAAPGIVALENASALADDHRRARRLAESLSSIEGIEFPNGFPETNIVLVQPAPPLPQSVVMRRLLGERGVRCFTAGLALRLVVHRGVDDDDLDHVVNVFGAIGKGVELEAMGMPEVSPY